MKRAIIIPSHPKFEAWLNNCLSFLKESKYPIIIVYNSDECNMFEMKAVKVGLELGLDEFFVLQDTVEVKNISFFDKIFEMKGTVFVNPSGQMFLNKYVKEDLERVNLPGVNDKYSAVRAETELANNLLVLGNVTVLFPDFIDNLKREDKFGRTNMVIENDFLKKYKGTWCTSMIN